MTQFDGKSQNLSFSFVKIFYYVPIKKFVLIKCCSFQSSSAQLKLRVTELMSNTRYEENH